MEVAIHDRAHHLSTELRAYVEMKMTGLADHLDLITAAEVEFVRDLKKRREPLHVVKIVLHLGGHRLPILRIGETGRDQRATFDLAMAKIEAEVTQLKERVKSHS